MKVLRTTFALALAAALLVVAPAGLAQSTPVQGNIQEQMSPGEFSAAGLGKLTPQELAALNAWLQRTLGQEVARAAETARDEGREEVVRKNRGFFDFGSKEPIVSNIVGEFRGFANGRTYTLANGQVWEQIEPASLAGVRRDSPKVTIRPSRLGTWYMMIEGYSTNAKVRRVE